MTPQENIAILENLISKIKLHVMCANFSSSYGAYRVLYPKGMHPQFDGVNVSYSNGKIKAATVVLEKLDLHYQQSILK